MTAQQRAFLQPSLPRLLRTRVCPSVRRCLRSVAPVSSVACPRSPPNKQVMVITATRKPGPLGSEIHIEITVHGSPWGVCCPCGGGHRGGHRGVALSTDSQVRVQSPQEFGVSGGSPGPTVSPEAFLHIRENEMSLLPAGRDSGLTPSTKYSRADLLFCLSCFSHRCLGLRLL